MRRDVRIGVMAAGGVALASAAAATVGNVLWSRATHRTVARLVQRRSTADRQAPRTYSPADIETLPAPVQRYFRYALRDGQPLVRSARIQERGDFAMKPGAWSPFTAIHHATVRPPGFVWDAAIRIAPAVPVRVRDSYIGGVGRMQARMAGVIPVVDQSGTPEMAAGSLHRYLAEAPWIPTALLPAAGVQWTPIDDAMARATLSDHGATVTVDFRFNERGEITGMAAERLRDVSGSHVLTPWIGEFAEYEEVGGMMIPRRGEVAWMLPDGPYPYWRGRISNVSYTFVE